MRYQRDVSWRWLIDVRGDEMKIDWPRLLAVLLLAEVVVGALVWLLAEALSPLLMMLVLLPIAVF